MLSLCMCRSAPTYFWVLAMNRIPLVLSNCLWNLLTNKMSSLYLVVHPPISGSCTWILFFLVLSDSSDFYLKMSSLYLVVHPLISGSCKWTHFFFSAYWLTVISIQNVVFIPSSTPKYFWVLDMNPILLVRSNCLWILKNVVFISSFSPTYF